ncbi:MAG: LCP family protein [Armatimonadota bacterium]
MPPPRRPRRRRTPVAARIFGAVFLLGLGFFSLRFGKIVGNIAGPKGTLSFLETIRNPRSRFPGKDRINILLIGKDYNRDRKGMPVTKAYVRDPETGTVTVRNIARADSILLLSCDLAAGTVAALSIPRDTKVTAPDGRTGKINATYARGGAELLRATVAELTGVRPDHVIAIKPDAIRTIVNLVGGVEVETLDVMKYDDSWGNLHIDLPKGRQRLDGNKAVGFARFREVKPGTRHSLEEGDGRRMARQQQLIRAMISRGKSPDNLLKADVIIKESLKQLEKDLTDEQIYALAALYRGIDTDKIASASLIGEGRFEGGYYFFPDPEKTRALVDWLIRGDAAAANRVTTVAVFNGTAVKGAARRIADKLHDEAGFDTVARSLPRTTEAAADLPRTRIYYAKAAHLDRARAIAGLLGGGEILKASGPDTQGVMETSKQRPDISVLLGRDLLGPDPATPPTP